MTDEFEKTSEDRRSNYLRESPSAYLWNPRGGDYWCLAAASNGVCSRVSNDAEVARAATESHVAGTGSAVRVGAGLPFSQSTAWPLDPARFHRGIETVVGSEIYRPRSINARDTPISSQLTRGRLCYSILRDESSSVRITQILGRARLPPFPIRESRKSSPSTLAEIHALRANLIALRLTCNSVPRALRTVITTFRNFSSLGWHPAARARSIDRRPRGLRTVTWGRREGDNGDDNHDDDDDGGD